MLSAERRCTTPTEVSARRAVQRERAATYVEEPLPQAPISPPHHPLDSRSPRSPGLIGSLTRKLTSNLTELSGKPWGWNRKALGGTILRHIDIRYREHVPYVNQVPTSH